MHEDQAHHERCGKAIEIMRHAFGPLPDGVQIPGSPLLFRQCFPLREVGNGPRHPEGLSLVIPQGLADSDLLLPRSTQDVRFGKKRLMQIHIRLLI